ncbi:MAG: hypothetical protein JWL83_2374 [Actinomycetia bacterium]|nr:hypothetical protein [Actinomycetes bacterium]
MGFLDKVKDAAGKAAEQAKHATSVAQEKLDDVRLTKRINDLYTEIGKLVVAKHRGSAPADSTDQMEAKIAEITDLEAQVEANNVEAESAAAPAPPAAPAPAPAPAPIAPENVPMAPPPPPAAS